MAPDNNTISKMRSKNLMAKLRRSKDAGGGRSKPNEGCKRHPKHRQSPGVCSLCLGEKLSQLSAHSSSPRYTTNTKIASSNCSSSSSLSSYCSSASSSSSSPIHRYRFTTDQGRGSSFPLLLFSGNSLLTKSRSVAFASNIRSKEGDDKKKHGGFFLSKLLHPSKSTKMKEEAIIQPTGLVHSRSTREISTTRVY